MKSFISIVTLSALVLGLAKVSQVEAVPSYGATDAVQNYGAAKPAYGDNSNNNGGYGDNGNNGGYKVKTRGGDEDCDDDDKKSYGDHIHDHDHDYDNKGYSDHSHEHDHDYKNKDLSDHSHDHDHDYKNKDYSDHSHDHDQDHDYNQNKVYEVQSNNYSPSYGDSNPDNSNYGKTVVVHNDNDDDDCDHPERYTKADYGLDITKILILINAERAKHNAKPLRIHRKLMLACKEQSEYQSKARSSTHYGPSGFDYKKRCEKQGYFSKNVAENISYNQDCEEDVVKFWVSSPEHYKNLINPDYTECGVSVKDKYWTHLFGCGNTEKKY